MYPKQNREEQGAIVKVPDDNGSMPWMISLPEACLGLGFPRWSQLPHVSARLLQLFHVASAAVPRYLILSAEASTVLSACLAGMFSM
jgi:hypothetical protein